jgi:hypothetical protein
MRSYTTGCGSKVLASNFLSRPNYADQFTTISAADFAEPNNTTQKVNTRHDLPTGGYYCDSMSNGRYIGPGWRAEFKWKNRTLN